MAGSVRTTPAVFFMVTAVITSNPTQMKLPNYTGVRSKHKLQSFKIEKNTDVLVNLEESLPQVRSSMLPAYCQNKMTSEHCTNNFNDVFIKVKVKDIYLYEVFIKVKVKNIPLLQ
jgi:biopolymer transport protein ExbD